MAVSLTSRRALQLQALCGVLAIASIMAPTLGVLFEVELAGWSPTHGHLGQGGSASHSHPYDHPGESTAHAHDHQADSAGGGVFTPSDAGSVVAWAQLAADPAPTFPGGRLYMVSLGEAARPPALASRVPTPPPQA